MHSGKGRALSLRVERGDQMAWLVTISPPLLLRPSCGGNAGNIRNSVSDPHRARVHDGDVDAVGAQVARQRGARAVQRRLAHAVPILRNQGPLAETSAQGEAPAGAHRALRFPEPASSSCSAATPNRHTLHRTPSSDSNAMPADYLTFVVWLPKDAVSQDACSHMLPYTLDPMTPRAQRERTSPPPVRPSPIDPILLPRSTTCTHEQCITCCRHYIAMHCASHVCHLVRHSAAHFASQRLQKASQVSELACHKGM